MNKIIVVFILMLQSIQAPPKRASSVTGHNRIAPWSGVGGLGRVPTVGVAESAGGRGVGGLAGVMAVEVAGSGGGRGVGSAGGESSFIANTASSLSVYKTDNRTPLQIVGSICKLITQKCISKCDRLSVGPSKVCQFTQQTIDPSELVRFLYIHMEQITKPLTTQSLDEALNTKTDCVVVESLYENLNTKINCVISDDLSKFLNTTQCKDGAYEITITEEIFNEISMLMYSIFHRMLSEYKEFEHKQIILSYIYIVLIQMYKVINACTDKTINDKGNACIRAIQTCCNSMVAICNNVLAAYNPTLLADQLWDVQQRESRQEKQISREAINQEVNAIRVFYIKYTNAYQQRMISIEKGRHVLKQGTCVFIINNERM